MTNEQHDFYDHFTNFCTFFPESTTDVACITPGYKTGEWMGVISAITQMFPNHIKTIDGIRSSIDFNLLLDQLRSHRINVVVFGGFTSSYRKLAKFLTSNDIRVYAVWFGNSSQNHKSHVINSFDVLISSVRDGHVINVGFARKGMEEFAASVYGLPNPKFVPSYHRTIPVYRPYQGSTISTGIYIPSTSWRKTPWSMIAAAFMFDNLELWIIGGTVSKKIQEGVNRLVTSYGNAELCKILDVVPTSQMASILEFMAFNLYVTYSECAPMLPLESFSVGTPCIMGNTHHYFEEPVENKYLRNHMVVDRIDDAPLIAEHIEFCISNRKEIMLEYVKWAVEYNGWCVDQLVEFISS